MSGINRVTILGRLGQDPTTRYTQGGTAVTEVSVATSEKWKDKQTGETKEESEWHRIVFWGRLGEIAGEYLRKGSQAYVEGKLKTEKYTDKEGIERYVTKIHAHEMQLLGGKPEGERKSERRQESSQPRDADFNDDDIPF